MKMFSSPTSEWKKPRGHPAHFIQSRLPINQAGDQYEQEADAMAEQVMRKCASCEKGEKVSRKEAPPSSKKGVGGAMNIGSLSTGGTSLPDASKNFFEPRFLRDFSQVKIHNDGQAHESANRINALAYTYGNNIVFGAHQFHPETEEGKKLLAHELTHVIQQTGTIQRKPDDQCRKDLPDIEDPELLGKDFKKMKSGISAAHRARKGKIKARNEEAGAYYLFNIHNNAGCDAVRPLVEGTEFFLIKEGLFYHQVWAQQPDTPADKFYWGWVDKDFLEFIEEKKQEDEDQKKKNEDEGKKTEDDSKDKADDPDGNNDGDGEKKKTDEPEKGENECDDESFCKPLADMSLAPAVKQGCMDNLETIVFPFLTSEAEDLWKAYMSRTPGSDMTPQELRSPDSNLANIFGEDDVTVEHQEKILENIVKKSGDQAIDVFADRAIFYRVEHLADHSLLTTPLEYDDVIGDPNTALTAGGAGGSDRRSVSGSIAIEPSEKNDITGEQNWRVWTKLTLWVKDTIDFCPGKCGAPLEKLILTLPLSWLEASGLVYDKPFEIYADIEPVYRDYLESDLKVRVIPSPT
jgi:hypothetical protein